MSFASYRRGLLRRFADREALPLEGAWAHFWSDLPKSEVVDFLHEVEGSYRIPAGLLRPTDSVQLLVAPVPARSWWRDHCHDLYQGEAASTLEFGIVAKREGRSLPKPTAWPETIDGLVRLYCEARGQAEEVAVV